MIPGLIKVLHDRQSIYQIGSNLTLFDFVHITNVVHAHLLAASQLLSESQSSFPTEDKFSHRLSLVNLTNPKRILPTSYQINILLSSPHTDPPLPLSPTPFSPVPPYSSLTPIAGSSFIITNGEPVPFWSFARAVWFAYNGHIPPYRVILPKGLALIFATISERVGEWMGIEVAMKRSNVRYVTCDLYFSIEKVSSLFLLCMTPCSFSFRCIR